MRMEKLFWEFEYDGNLPPVLLFSFPFSTNTHTFLSHPTNFQVSGPSDRFCFNLSQSELKFPC